MMTNTTTFSIDELFQYLGYTEGSFQDRERAFLKREGDYKDWDAFLTAKGFTTGAIADRQKAWLAKTLLVSHARRNRGYAIVPQEIGMEITVV